MLGIYCLSQGEYEGGGESSTVIISRCDYDAGYLLCVKSYGGSKVYVFNVFAEEVLLFDVVFIGV